MWLRRAGGASSALAVRLGGRGPSAGPQSVDSQLLPEGTKGPFAPAAMLRRLSAFWLRGSVSARQPYVASVAPAVPPGPPGTPYAASVAWRPAGARGYGASGAHAALGIAPGLRLPQGRATPLKARREL